MYFINGNPYSAENISMEGEGASDPVVINWTSTAHLNAGDVIDLRTKNADAGSGNITVTFKRLYFAIKEDI